MADTVCAPSFEISWLTYFNEFVETEYSPSVKF